MSKTILKLLCGLALLGSVSAPVVAAEAAREEGKLLIATQVLDELRQQRDTVIPERLLQQAYGVAVIPDVAKAAVVFGGRRGSGILVVRDSRGRFSNPIFVDLTGGSVGFQIGVQETDIVLVFTTKRGIEGIQDGKLTLGAGASVAAGPVGRQAEAAAGVNAEIYAYSRARGLFAGVALDGTAITIANKSNSAFYNRHGVTVTEIMDGTATQSSENARRFLAALAASTGETAAGMSSAGSASAAPAAGNGANGNTPAGEVKTFPMADPEPGKEPR
jgi:lipid-binding SYLF domain-containing protein